MNHEIYLCYNKDYVNLNVISEYIDSFNDNYKIEVLEISNQSCYKFNGIYIFIQSIPEILVNSQMKNIILLNIEQLTIEKNIIMVNKLLNKNIKIIDYSIENIKLMENNNIGYLPYQYNDSEVYKLKIYNTIANKKYDVAFTGWISDRRRLIIDKLRAKGITVLLINNKWEDDRDMEIASARLLLNIHYNENYNIYESIRCDRWIFAGMMVVSEDSIYNESLDINNLVIFEKYDKLVDKVIEVINNYGKYNGEFIINHRDTINNIKTKREVTYDQFIGMIK